MSSQDEKTLLVEIPKTFYSDAANAPFSRCMNCDRYLLDGDTQYVIEKAVKRYKDFSTTDTIFEYAICLKCHEEIISAYSQSSLENIRNYFSENVDFERRIAAMQKNIKDGNFNLDNWLSRCAVKGTPVNQMSEYQIGCQCVGNKMAVMNMPFLIGNEAMDEISQLLSNKTIGEMDRFIDEFFGLPPDLKKLIKDSGVLII